MLRLNVELGVKEDVAAQLSLAQKHEKQMNEAKQEL